MANMAMARLESALRDRKLDRTLTTALPPCERRDDSAAIAIDIAALDACLRGGLPRGQLSEIVGSASSGRTALVLQTIAASTRRGEIAALVDTFGRHANDLRISVTDRCNFRCTYCMPAEGLPWLPKPEILTFEEIATLLRVFVGLGVTGIKLTVRGVVDGMSNDDFVKAAEAAKEGCPVSKALTGTTITLDAALA